MAAYSGVVIVPTAGVADLLYSWVFVMGWEQQHLLHWGKVGRASVCMEDVVEVTAVMTVRLAWPFFLAFWYCSQWD